MNDDNPYRAPTSAIGPGVRRTRPTHGPIATGLVAVVLATVFAGAPGLLASFFAVGSWWAYKFWPRPREPEAEGTRAFLQRLEGSPSGEVPPVEASGQQSREQAGDVLGDLRL